MQRVSELAEDMGEGAAWPVCKPFVPVLRPQCSRAITARWYILDLAPINEVDTKAMPGEATDYTIETEANFVDVIIAIFVPAVTSRTVAK